MRGLFVLLGGAGLTMLAAACTMSPAPVSPLPTEPQPVAPGPIPGTCDTTEVSWAVGQLASADVLEQVTLQSGARSARVLHPGDVVTMEFLADRLTISVDAGNSVIGLSCS